MYPPDTLDSIEHDRSVAENARAVLRSWGSMVEAFGGSPEVAAMTAEVMRDHPALA